jgi:hypothetical protein
MQKTPGRRLLDEAVPAGQPVEPNGKGLLPIVPLTGTCPTGKWRYGTAAEAEEALRRLTYNRKVLNSENREGRYYPMPGDAPCMCGGYHTTHQEKRNR